ncbi:hypothetical protein GCM10010440_61290 [Kitasatospora cinereorecta]
MRAQAARKRTSAQVLGGRLLIEVHDASGERPALRPEVGGEAESGRGLRLVTALAVAWGCCPRPGGVGKFVWALVGPVEGESGGGSRARLG